MKDAVEAEATASDSVSASGSNISPVFGTFSVPLELSTSLAVVLAAALVVRGDFFGELRVDAA